MKITMLLLLLVAASCTTSHLVYNGPRPSSKSVRHHRAIQKAWNKDCKTR